MNVKMRSMIKIRKGMSKMKVKCIKIREKYW